MMERDYDFEVDYASAADFTQNAQNVFYDLVDSKAFKDRDAEAIYEVLREKYQFISFGDYLKRYICKKAGLQQEFNEVTLREYQMIIKSAFEENNTPSSFTPNTAKLSALSKNWLTQRSVSREVVFLLGFGLGMDVKDVNDFLKKALREQGFNAKNPFEVICWYCFKNKYGFPKFYALWSDYQEKCAKTPDSDVVYEDSTVNARDIARRIESDEDLFRYVMKLRRWKDKPSMSVSMRECFDRLYERAKVLVAAYYSVRESTEQEAELEEYEEKLFQDDQLSEAEIRSRVARKKENQREYLPENITDSELAGVISSTIPVNSSGNLIPSKNSTLNEQFAGKRFSRQRLNEILSGKSEVNRFDLITLEFFIYSQTLEEHPDPKNRFISFWDDMNKILKECYLGELNISNPYECFLLMCILAEDPFGSYLDVLEMSYEES